MQSLQNNVNLARLILLIFEFSSVDVKILDNIYIIIKTHKKHRVLYCGIILLSIPWYENKLFCVYDEHNLSITEHKSYQNTLSILSKDLLKNDNVIPFSH